MTAISPILTFDNLIAPIHGTRFAELRIAQDSALRLYCDSAHAKSDVAIELPTGAGKTLIALLILDFWRRAGRRVAILTGNKTLARQIGPEAEDLGVPIVRFEGPGRDLSRAEIRKYERRQAIAVMNYWLYVNQEPVMEPAEYLVLDDAQLAEGALTSLYTAVISRKAHPTLFSRAMSMIADRTPSPIAYSSVRELATGPTPFRPADLLPFTEFAAIIPDLEVMVDDYIVRKPDGDTQQVIDLGFRWGRIRASLGGCLCLLSADEIELRPGCFPTLDYPHLAAPAQRLYMSATLHDPEDLQRRLGVGAIEKLALPEAVIHEEDGRRLLVFNQDVAVGPGGEVPEMVLDPLRALLRAARKSVWLCKSGLEADRWLAWLRDFETSSGNGGSVWRLSPMGEEIDEFRLAEAGHLIIAGRFEGMDFPGETCRLCVLPSVPSATNLLERFTTEQLRDAAFMQDRIRERMKQGIGRCTRGADDYAVYYFLDPQFVDLMEADEFGEIVSPETRRQIELGLELTADGFQAVVPLGTAFLGGDFTEFETRMSEVVPPPRRSIPPMAQTADREMRGWLGLFGRNDYPAAARRFSEVVADLGGSSRELRAFWCYLAAFAEYRADREVCEPGARDRCLRWLDQAMTVGGTSSWFNNRVRRTANELRGTATPTDQLISAHDRMFDGWDAFVERYPYHRGRFRRWHAGLQQNLNGTHDQVSEVLEVIGTLLGFAASRPAGSGMPDNLWEGEAGAITIEAKIDVTRSEVILDDVDQCDGQRRAAVGRLGFSDEATRGIIVTNMTGIDGTARAALGRLRVLTVAAVEALRARLESIMADYWQSWSRTDATVRAQSRVNAARRLPRAGWLERAIDRRERPFITTDDLFAEWP